MFSVFFTTRKQQTSYDRITNVHSSRICPLGVEHSNRILKRKKSFIPEELSPKHKF